MTNINKHGHNSNICNTNINNNKNKNQQNLGAIPRDHTGLFIDPNDSLPFCRQGIHSIYIIHFSCLYIHLITLFGYIILKTRQGTFVGPEMDNQMDPHGSFDGTLAKKGSSKILSEFSNLNTLDLSLVMLAAGIQLMRSYQVFY